jgi:hypothetical protein
MEIVSKRTLKHNNMYILCRVQARFVTGDFDESDKVQFVCRLTYSGIITDLYVTSNIKFQ